MSDGGSAPGREPTEGELRAYLADVRQSDAREVVAQAFSMLVGAAEVKLGRRDARLLIDAAASLVSGVAPQLDAELVGQMEDVLDRFRLAQVDAERQLAELRARGEAPEHEAGDLAAPSATPETAAGPSAADARPEPSPASRLWVPGRGR